MPRPIFFDRWDAYQKNAREYKQRIARGERNTVGLDILNSEVKRRMDKFLLNTEFYNPDTGELLKGDDALSYFRNNQYRQYLYVRDPYTNELYVFSRTGEGYSLSNESINGDEYPKWYMNDMERFTADPGDVDYFVNNLKSGNAKKESIEAKKNDPAFNVDDFPDDGTEPDVEEEQEEEYQDVPGSENGTVEEEENEQPEQDENDEPEFGGNPADMSDDSPSQILNGIEAGEFPPKQEGEDGTEQNDTNQNDEAEKGELEKEKEPQKDVYVPINNNESFESEEAGSEASEYDLADKKAADIFDPMPEQEKQEFEPLEQQDIDELIKNDIDKLGEFDFMDDDDSIVSADDAPKKSDPQDDEKEAEPDEQEIIFDPDKVTEELNNSPEVFDAIIENIEKKNGVKEESAQKEEPDSPEKKTESAENKKEKAEDPEKKAEEKEPEKKDKEKEAEKKSKEDPGKKAEEKEQDKKAEEKNGEELNIGLVNNKELGEKLDAMLSLFNDKNGKAAQAEEKAPAKEGTAEKSVKEEEKKEPVKEDQPKKDEKENEKPEGPATEKTEPANDSPAYPTAEQILARMEPYCNKNTDLDQLEKNVRVICTKMRMASENIAQGCENGKGFTAGSDIRDMATYHALCNGQMNSGMIELFSSKNLDAVTNYLSRLSPDINYAADHKHETSFYMNNVLDPDKSQKLFGDYDKIIENAATMWDSVGPYVTEEALMLDSPIKNSAVKAASEKAPAVKNDVKENKEPEIPNVGAPAM